MKQVTFSTVYNGISCMCTKTTYANGKTSFRYFTIVDPVPFAIEWARFRHIPKGFTKGIMKDFVKFSKRVPVIGF